VSQRKILFIDTTHPALYEQLEEMGYRCDQFPGYNRDDFKRIIPEYTGIIIRSKIKLDRNFLQHAGRCKFIGRVGAGMENIDVDYAESRGIVCLNAPEGNRDAVGEQAVGMLLSLFNNLIRADREVRQGIWLREENRGVELGGKTVGIIGYGNTGGAFARKLKGFGCRVLAYDKYKSGFSDDFVRESTQQDIFKYSDVVSLHVPLTGETLFMADSAFFDKFTKPVYVVNTSRGKVLKTVDLVKKIKSGKVSGACLDVLEYEGLSYENLKPGQLPDDFQQLIKLPNVILSPHIAGWTVESNYKLAKVLADKIRKLDI